MTAIAPSRFAGCMGFLPRRRNGETHQGSARGARKKLNASACELGALPHRDQAEAVAPPLAKPRAAVLHFQRQAFVGESEPDFGLLRAGVPGDVVQRLLEHPVEMNRLLAADGPRSAAPAATHGDAGPTLEQREV